MRRRRRRKKPSRVDRLFGALKPRVSYPGPEKEKEAIERAWAEAAADRLG